MKIVTSGCSFTHAYNSWANVLAETHDVLNVAQGGAGNEMIVRNAMKAIKQYEPQYTFVELSGINRYELIADRVLEHASDHVVLDGKFSWIKSTGNIDWALESQPDIRVPVEMYHKYCYSYNLQLMRTLVNIVYLQDRCRIYDSKLKIFWWQRELSDVIFKEFVEPSDELLYWWAEIDWNNFWHHEDFDGLAEWGIHNGFTGDLEEDHMNQPPKGWLMIDGKKTMIGHPSSECHRAFAEKVVLNWL